jgi:ADP-ribosylglycohydrolase
MLHFMPNVMLERARLSLEGLSLGDGFGERFFAKPATLQSRIDNRTIPEAPWRYTDDTMMAISIVEVLETSGEIDQDKLAHAFLLRYAREPARGYGAGAHRLFNTVAQGTPWREAAAALFNGTGSMGNGGAMRAAPIGAYFADDYRRVATEARKSAEVTHTNPEGIAGAIAVAVAAAWAHSHRGEAPDRDAFFATVLEHTPPGETRTGIEKAQAMPDADIATAVKTLGSGQKIISQDTVPFSLWSAIRHMDDFVEAMWNTVVGLGDRDTTCAIVGGIVALSCPSLPTEWVQAREPLP